MNRLLKTSSICGPALLFAAAAHAQLVAPVAVEPLVMPMAPLQLPAQPATIPLMPSPADVPALPVPALPGVPMYRLAAAAPAVALAAPAAARVTERKASEVRPAAPVKAIERARRAFGLSGKKPDARRLQALFDGARGVDADGYLAIVDEVERPQTLPENDLLREIGVR